MTTRWMLAAITVAGLGYSSDARADAVANFTPSRTSGVAPLAVFFDAKASTCDGCAMGWVGDGLGSDGIMLGWVDDNM
jgi:hypothetical protein